VANSIEIIVRLLKHLDLALAAVLVGAAVAPVSSGYLCTESSCRSPFDTAQFYGLGILAIALAAILCRVSGAGLSECSFLLLHSIPPTLFRNGARGMAAGSFKPNRERNAWSMPELHPTRFVAYAGSQPTGASAPSGSTLVSGILYRLSFVDSAARFTAIESSSTIAEAVSPM
jgi:hypothetical protein